MEIIYHLEVRLSDNMPYEKIGNNEPVCIADEVPFDIPESWEWVRLNLLAIKEIKRGKSPKYAENSNIQVFAQKCNVKTGGINMSLAKKLDPKVLEKYPTDEYLQDSDIIINSTGNGTLGRIGVFSDSDRINDNIIVPDSHVTIVRCTKSICDSYLYYVLKYYQPNLEKLGEGSTNQTELKPITISELFIPIPPLNEQKIIVEKIKSVLPLVDIYDEKENELIKYNVEFPDMLKKSILQMAIQGKLVEQNSEYEPTSVLLQRIKAEKDSLIKAGKIKKDKNESTIFRRDNSYYEKIGKEERCIDDEIPFDIPDNWEWTRLNNLCYFIGGYAYKSNEFISESKYQVLRLGNVKNNYLKLETKPVFISEKLAEQTKGFLCKANDILITMTGTRGKRDYFFTVKIEDNQTNYFINQRVGCLRTFFHQLSDWLIWILKSETVLNQVFQHETGTANQGNLGAENIMKTLIPLPPENEQSRIIEKLHQISYFLEVK